MLLACETDVSSIDTTLNESEDAGNKIVGSAHSPACPLSSSMEEETGDPSSRTGLEHVSDGSVLGCEDRETVQNSEPDLSSVDVEEVELDTEEAMPPD